MQKLLHTLKIDKVYKGYIIYLYEGKTSEGLKFYESFSNHPSGSSTHFETKKEMINFYNEWLEELKEPTI